MNEALLHTIWKYKLFESNRFIGTKGEIIEIISVGNHNYDAGPDFFNSKIKINNILLVGNTEIHIKTSDWLKHKHQSNKAYDNLVLHVVYENDRDLEQNINFNVSVLELKNYIKPSLLNKYIEIESSHSKIPCGKSITSVPDIIWKSWMDTLVIDRTERKTNYITSLFNYSKQNYEDTLYALLFRNFGFKINDEPFELLGKSIPYTTLKKYSNNLLQLEALLYGVAGFLNEFFEDEYPKLLQNEFEFLKQKHHLVTLKTETWKFSKTRPVNFPTIRISQLASLINKNQSLYHLLETKPSLDTLKLFFSVKSSNYWRSHYRFDVQADDSEKLMGELAFNSVVINTIVPFLVFMSRQTTNDSFLEYSLQLLTQLPAEVNVKTKEYLKLGIKTENALESQAQIQLFDGYCTQKRCLNCRVGEYLLKKAV